MDATGAHRRKTGEWPAGTLWMGSSWGLHRVALSDASDSREWWHKTDFDVQYPAFQNFIPTREALWFSPIAFRKNGVYRYSGDSFEILIKEDGLPDEGIRHIFRASEGTIWFVGTEGISRLRSEQGNARWTRFSSSDGIHLLESSLNVTEAGDGTLWIDVGRKQVLRFRDHEPAVPETNLASAVDRVSPAGNILVRWSGTTRWNLVQPEDLSYRWRLVSSSDTAPDDWTETDETDITFTSLDPGDYRFEVYSLAPSLRYDTTPAVHTFVVAPPWWRDPRFAIPILGLIVVVMMQSVRVVRRDRHLRLANQALSEANNELFGLNRDLQLANVEISEQSERKSAFLASMSHELRTPMNAIKGFTRLVARREPNLTERGKENLGKVDRASDHLMAQINDLLDLSKIEAGKMDVNKSTFDVAALISECVNTVSPLVKEGIQLIADVDASVGQAETDEQRLRQMVINLLSNAVKFTDDGSVTVNVSISEQGSPPPPKASAGQAGGGESGGKVKTLTISVSDTGKGIPEDELPMLFDEYRQVKGQSESEVQRGTGLGLSITKKFAELLGGSVSVESVVGKGSTFTVSIPATYNERGSE